MNIMRNITLTAGRRTYPAARSSNDGVFYIRTNPADESFRLMAAPVSNPRGNCGARLFPSSRRMLAAVEAFQDALCSSEPRAACPTCASWIDRRTPRTACGSHRVEFTEPATTPPW